MNIYPLNTISSIPPARLSTGYLGFDEVLGGGLVQGSTMILAGFPGAGKSSLLIQLSYQLANGFGKKVLYVNGEENKEQIKMRAVRFGIDSETILLNEDTEVENIIQTMSDVKPDVMIVDSLQMLYSNTLKHAPGTPTQMKNGLLSLCKAAKQMNITLIFIGHATKGGYIAGLQTFQHMVDVVLYLGIDDESKLRYLQAKKNRFGSIDYVWQLYMMAWGLTDDPKSNLNYMVPASKTVTITNEEMLRLANKSFWGSFVTNLYMGWLKKELVK